MKTMELLRDNTEKLSQISVLTRINITTVTQLPCSNFRVFFIILCAYFYDIAWRHVRDFLLISHKHRILCIHFIFKSRNYIIYVRTKLSFVNILVLSKSKLMQRNYCSLSILDHEATNLQVKQKPTTFPVFQTNYH